MPGADQELNNMAEMLGGLMTETFHSTDASFGGDAVMNSDAEKILARGFCSRRTAIWG